MQQGQPSRTALGAARHRAAHQVFERGFIFSDPLALRILGPDAEAAVREADDDPSRRRLRLFIAVRTRFAEDSLAAAVARGVRQLVVLGAGLDTYAYRTCLGEHACASSRSITRRPKPGSASGSPRRRSRCPARSPSHRSISSGRPWRDGLSAAGFDPAHESFFTWLGVVPYLTEQAVVSTLGFIAGLPGGAHVVFDYGNPPRSSTGQDEHAAAHEALAARVASAGEAFRCHFETDALRGRLAALGFREIEDLGPAAIRERYFANRGGSVPDRGGHIVRATTVLRHLHATRSGPVRPERRTWR